MPTTAACPDYAYTPAEDAPVVARLLAAGAVLLGKVNLDQFATGLNGTRSPHGTPRNPVVPDCVPGGSSSGSATAVASGIAGFSLGTDTAGSGRVPAMLNNIVGLKPSLGLVPTQGVVPACRSLDFVSVFALTVADAAAVLEVMAGPPRPTAIPVPPRPAGAPRRRRSRPGAWPRRWRSNWSSTARTMPRCTTPPWRGPRRWAAPHPVDIAPFLAIARRLYDGAWVAERTAALRDLLAAKPEAIHPVTRGILEAGLDKRTIDAWDDFHAAAEARRWPGAVRRDRHPAAADRARHADAGRPGGRAGGGQQPARHLHQLRQYLRPLGPGRALRLPRRWPAGRRHAGRPGLRRGAAGRARRRAACGGGRDAGRHRRATPPPPAPPALAPGEIPLLAIGAHMAGLPLNPQVLRHGGRFVTAARTAPLYRFYDLGNRPGLVRVADGGVAIAGEVWAFPAASIGPFLAEIPPPLGFGRVTLEDGSTPLGFLCEAAGVIGTPGHFRHRWVARAYQGEGTGLMEVDIPEVLAEMQAMFAEYERALVTNDVAVLQDLFRKDARTLRYGPAENLWAGR